jgi:hypothetical protein
MRREVNDMRGAILLCLFLSFSLPGFAQDIEGVPSNVYIIEYDIPAGVGSDFYIKGFLYMNAIAKGNIDEGTISDPEGYFPQDFLDLVLKYLYEMKADQDDIDDLEERVENIETGRTTVSYLDDSRLHGEIYITSNRSSITYTPDLTDLPSDKTIGHVIQSVVGGMQLPPAQWDLVADEDNIFRNKSAQFDGTENWIFKENDSGDIWLYIHELVIIDTNRDTIGVVNDTNHEVDINNLMEMVATPKYRQWF